MMASACVALAPGLVFRPGYLDPPAQTRLLADVRAILSEAPLYRPVMPGSGKPLSVAMSNCGRLGWYCDRAGYRYTPTHPTSGAPWPDFPTLVLDAWRDLADHAPEPEACLVNYYAPGARMGLHQDRDEAATGVPVVSLSLGDTCVFRYGGLRRQDPTCSVKLASGDALVLGGAARLAFHGVDRILAGSSTLLKEGGRINLTIRRVCDSPA